MLEESFLVSLGSHQEYHCVCMNVSVSLPKKRTAELLVQSSEGKMAVGNRAVEEGGERRNEGGEARDRMQSLLKYLCVRVSVCV